MNVSRGGLLLGCKDALSVGHPLWVTIPFDPEQPGMQPETLARVVRCAKYFEENGGAPAERYMVAMHFEGAAHSYGRSDTKHAANGNHNGSSKIALPIRVRPRDVPWFEEAMTQEVSREKLRFVTNRQYNFGEPLMLSFAAGGEGPWGGEGEWETHVTGIEMEAGSESLCVTVRKKPREGWPT
jgi:hypothetical protein